MSGNLYAELMFSSSFRRYCPADFCRLRRSGGLLCFEEFFLQKQPPGYDSLQCEVENYLDEVSREAASCWKWLEGRLSGEQDMKQVLGVRN